MWSSHPLSLIISFILDITFSSSVFICLSAWRPRLTSDQCRRICEFLKVWRGDGLQKSLQGVGHWYRLVLCVCVCVFAGWYMGNQSLEFLGQILLWYLEAQGNCWVTNYENITHPLLSFSLSSLSSNPLPGLGEKTKPRLRNWELWAKRRWTRVNLRCFCQSMFTTYVIFNPQSSII